MKLRVLASGAGLLVSLLSSAYAMSPGQGSGQVFFRGGLGFATESRGGQVFTDNNAVSGRNGEKNGWNIGAGLNLTLWQEMGPGNILGEILLNYSEFSSETVRQTTSTLIGAPIQSKVAVSELAVTVSPKYRLEQLFEGKVRPWIIPAGMAFLVNSPPSNDSTYLDVGYHAGLGLEVVLIRQLSLGADFRYTLSFKRAEIDASHYSADAYIGVNF